jgi:ATP-binding cassette subfamily B protein
MMQQALAACERIFTLLEERQEVPDPETPAPLPAAAGPIEFDGVHFAYVEGTPVLRDVSFRVEPGETVAVVGATGSGKTTLVNLLMRFYDVQQGRIAIGGVDVRAVRQQELRRRVGAVRQEPFLFSATVAENIRLMDPEVPREAVEAAARHVNADGFIRKLPQGYDTRLNERGAGLVGGSEAAAGRWRRIMARDQAGLLILDEATANVDSETEALIQEALRGSWRTGPGS